MTAKEFVKQRMPTAKAEKHISGRVKGFQKEYWLIREIGQTYYFSEGTSESNAWVNAKKHILEKEKNENK